MKAGYRRQTYYVCSAIQESSLVSELIMAPTTESAIDFFNNKFNIKPQQIFGPFYKKKEKILESNRSLKFLDCKAIKCIYNDWEVNAFKLLEPKDTAYLIFIRRVDGKKISPPQGTIVVKLSELRI